MNRKLKAQLKMVFDAPRPKRKKEFLLTLNFPGASWLDFVISQIWYIRKRVWVISVLLAAAMIFGLYFNMKDNNLNLIWIASSAFPFVSLVSITEIARSMSYNMEELEMSCRFNFSNVMLARLSILGGFNITALGLTVALLMEEAIFGILRLTVYLLTPYLLTCLLSLFILNRLRSRDAAYMCGIISCFVSIANTLFNNQNKIVSWDNYLLYSGTVLCLLLVCTAAEIYKLFKKTEELQWNLSLTG